MTKEELLKLEPGTLVDVTVDGDYWGYYSLINVVELPNDEWVRAYVVGWGRGFSPDQISLHVPQPQVSGTIETPPKLYTFAYGNATPATDAEIMAQECVDECAQAMKVCVDDYIRKNDALSARLKTARLKVCELTQKVAVKECFDSRLTEAQNTERVLKDEIAKRNEQIHNLRMRVEQLEAKLANELGRTIWAQSQVSILEAKLDELETPPTTDEVKHAYNALLAGGNKDEARVLQTLSHVVERLSEELSAKN